MILDLTFKSKINNSFSENFEIITNKTIDDFHKIVEKISYDNLNNIDWWVSSVSSRNTIQSPFFHHICTVNFLSSLDSNDKNKISIIYADNIILEKIYRQLLKNQNITIKVKKNIILTKLLIFLKNYYELINAVYYRFIQFFLTKYIYKKKYDFRNSHINIIDKYFFPGFLDKERYYNGLLNFLSNDNKKRTFFVPTIVMFKANELTHVYSSLVKKNNLIIKEHFLKFRDYIYALMYFNRVNLINIKDCSYKNINLKPLIKYELKQTNLSFFASVEAILNLRFFHNLKLANVKINTSIDWFENQVVDRGWNLGFNKYFKKSKSYGYLGFIPKDMLLSEMYITKNEYDADVIPKKLFVIGKKLIQDRKRFYKNYDVDIAPAFRFNDLYNVKRIKQKNNIICLILPVIYEDAIEILKNFEKISHLINSNNIEIFIKPHPTLINKMNNNLSNLSFKYNTITKNIYNIISSSSVIITGASSICMEAIVLGIPLAVIKLNRNFQLIPIPYEVDSNLWKLCKSNQDLLNYINTNLNLSDTDYTRKNELMINDYFLKPSIKTTNNLIN